MYEFKNEIITNPVIFKDEPHFQYEILHRGIPLLFKKREYYPLVTEFPSSPGIDLIYFNVKGEIILAELKHNSTKFELAQKETIHHYEKYKKWKISEIIEYAKANEMETNQLNLEKFLKTFCHKTNLSLQDLYAKKKLDPIALFNGIEPSKVPSICSDVVFLSFDEKSVRVKSEKYFGDTITTKKFYDEYNQENLRNNVIRKLRSKNELEYEIQLTKIPFIKNIYVVAKERKFHIKPGSGQALSYLVQIMDSYKKYRTILKVFETQVGIPGNLYNQRRYLNVSTDELDNYFDNIKRLFGNFNIRETDAGTVIISIDNLSDNQISQLFNELYALKTIVQSDV